MNDCDEIHVRMDALYGEEQARRFHLSKEILLKLIERETADVLVARRQPDHDQNDTICWFEVEYLAGRSVSLADALLAELAKKPKEGS